MNAMAGCVSPASIQIELGWPAKALSPNFRSRSHWPKTNALKKAKKEGHLSTLAAMRGGGAPKWSNAIIPFSITAYPPDLRDRDDDNLKASLKGHRDGIALALGIDDSRFAERFQWGEPVKGGRIIVTIGGAA
jgi:crossover junction endodeoxyribonuclease RusA